MIQVEVIGQQAAIKGIDKAEREFVQYMEENVQVLADGIQEKAKQRAPVDFGFLKNSITKEVSGLNAEVGTPLDYAPYIEFGTGGKVEVPNGLEDYAIQFKGAGERQVNLPARPFLFNSAFEEVNELKEKLKQDGVLA